MMVSAELHETKLEPKAVKPDAKLQLKASEIQTIVSQFLVRCGLRYPVIPDHSAFQKECYELSVERGYITQSDKTFGYFIPGGVSMACNAYAHLEDYNARMFICLYTVFLIYLDDMFEHDINAVLEFNHRFVTRQKQHHKVLDDFADLLLEMPNIWSPLVANIMTTSTLNLVSALSLERELEGVKLEKAAALYPTFSRVMSGASETYALFMFPSEIPLKAYIQSLPDLMIFINATNDVLSFYKEEAAGETVNRIHLTSKCLEVSQREALLNLVDDDVKAHYRIIDILKGSSRQAYLDFSQGYIGFHAGLPERYRLHELKL